jgi:hypothetical protein
MDEDREYRVRATVVLYAELTAKSAKDAIEQVDESLAQTPTMGDPGEVSFEVWDYDVTSARKAKPGSG